MEFDMCFDATASFVTGGALLPTGIHAPPVAVPLVSSSDRAVRFFGAFVLGSVVVGVIVFEHAFVFIRCLFAAVISVYIAFLLHQVAGAGRRTDVHARVTASATASSEHGEQPS